jgi:hypothetical protein
MKINIRWWNLIASLDFIYKELILGLILFRGNLSGKGM